MNDGGFTLIEIIVVLALFSILALAAEVHYRAPIQAVSQASAKIALFSWATALEDHYDQHGSYRGFSQPKKTIANYELRLLEVQDHTYKIGAIPKVEDECGGFFLDQNGAQTVNGAAKDCW